MAIFKEPLGCNPLINGFRNATPEARTIDEHPLVPDDFRIACQHFRTVRLDHFGLMTLAFIPFRNTIIARPLFFVLRSIDRVVLALPGLRWQAWHVLITMTNNGTGSGTLTVALPVQAVTVTSFSGRNPTSGKMLQGAVSAGTSTLNIRNYDGTYPVATGETPFMSGSYEVA